MNIARFVSRPVACMLLCLAAAPLQGKAEQVAAEASVLRVVYFHSKTCHECKQVDEALPIILSHFGSAVALETYDIQDMSAVRSFCLYQEHYQADVQAPPAIFVGGSWLAGRTQIAERLSAAIERELKMKSVTFDPSLDERAPGESVAADPVRQRFLGLGLGTLAMAGLLDGINPCAFTTIIFLISMLAYMGKSRRQLLVVGAGFAASVFVTYLLLGVGLLWAIKAFSVNHGIAKAMTYTVAGLTFTVVLSVMMT